MKIRIVCEGFKSFSVERQDENGVWEHWLPHPSEQRRISTPYEALAYARDERDYQIEQKCKRLGCGGHVDVEI